MDAVWSIQGVRGLIPDSKKVMLDPLWTNPLELKTKIFSAKIVIEALHVFPS